MPYSRFYPAGWRNRPDTSTPISAAALQHIEDAVEGVVEQVDEGVDGRIQLTPGRVYRVADPFAPGDRSRDFLVMWTAAGPVLMNSDIVTADAAAFAKLASNPNVLHGFADSSGTHATFVRRADGNYHMRENRRLIIIADSMGGIQAVRNKDPQLSIALGHPIDNQGVSGDRMDWITARVATGAAVKVLDGRTGAPNTGTIPSTGECNIQVFPQLGANTGPYWCLIDGVAGMFTPTELPISPDPLSASDPGTITSHYDTGVFRRFDQGGMSVQVEDWSRLQTGRNIFTGAIYARHWPVIQPSRHDFQRRYQAITPGGSAGSLTLIVGSTILDPVAWNPTGPSLGAATITASNNRIGWGSAHSMVAGSMFTLAGLSGGGPLVNGKIYIVRTAPTTTAVTVVGPDGLDLDITADGTSTGATETPESAFAVALNAQLVAKLGAGWTGSIDVLTNLPGQTTDPGQVQADWGVADTPDVFALVTADAGVTVTLGQYRTGIQDTVADVHAILEKATSDARAHAIVFDLGPFPGEEDGTARRKLLDACNAALARTFPDIFFPLWQQMRNPALVTRTVAGTALAGVAPTTADLTAINTTRMTPPTFTDTGGYTPTGISSGGHPGDVGADARALLLQDRWNAMPRGWDHAA